jgi:hypothetical protein
MSRDDPLLRREVSVMAADDLDAQSRVIKRCGSPQVIDE